MAGETKEMNLIKKWRFKGFIHLYNEHQGFFWFIKSKGLYDEFLNFYDNFSLEKIDDYKQKERAKK